MNLRSLPRTFVEGASPDGPIELPPEELNKIKKVLRLSTGAELAILPNDGTLIYGRLNGDVVDPIAVHRPETESPLELTLAQALPKGDKLEEIVRAGTELGVARFIVFPSDRSVVRWDAKKIDDRLARLRIIARESAEVSFRVKMPEIFFANDLSTVLVEWPQAAVLSEVEGLSLPLRRVGENMAIVIGPEGGWSPRELQLVGDRGVTLGPRVLRVDHAGPAAAALLLLGP